MNCPTCKSGNTQTAKILILSLLIILSGCNQRQETVTSQKPVILTIQKPTVVPVTDKVMTLNSTGVGFIKFGTSYDEMQKILTDKKIIFRYVPSDNESLLFIDETLQVDGVPIPRLSLAFNKKNMLGTIEISTDIGTWKVTETFAAKLNSKTTELFGKPIKSHKISEALFNDVSQTNEYMSWSKNKTSAVAHINQPRRTANISTCGYNVTFILQHSSFVNKSKSTSSYATPDPLTKAGKRVKAKHPDWDDVTCSTIGAGEIFLGMTKEQVRVAWGRPYKVNTTKTVYGTREQWVMHEIGSTYVYFEDGIYTALQK